jgi:hypothetical protein
MSKFSTDGKWVWNVQPPCSGHLKLTGGQLEVDSNGLHLCRGPGHCGGLIASFPLGTLVWREELPPVAAQAEAPPAVELVAGQMAEFDLPARIEIGSINITCHEGGAESIAEAFAQLAKAGRDRAVG